MSLEDHVVSLKLFTHDPRHRTLSADASDLGWRAGQWGLWLCIRSHVTGHEFRFAKGPTIAHAFGGVKPEDGFVYRSLSSDCPVEYLLIWND